VHAGEYEELFPQLHVDASSYLVIVTRGTADDCACCVGRDHPGALHRHDRQQAQGDSAWSRSSKRKALRWTPSTACSHPWASKIRRRHPGRDRGLGGGRDDRAPPRRGFRWRALSKSLFAPNPGGLPQVNVGGVILAAGASMNGAAKALARVVGECFLDRLIGVLASLATRYWWLLGYHAETSARASPARRSSCSIPPPSAVCSPASNAARRPAAGRAALFTPVITLPCSPPPPSLARALGSRRKLAGPAGGGRKARAPGGPGSAASSRKCSGPARRPGPPSDPQAPRFGAPGRGRRPGILETSTIRRLTAGCWRGEPA